MWIWWIGVRICNSSCTGGRGGLLVEGVANFNYIGRSPDQTDDDWTEV